MRLSQITRSTSFINTFQEGEQPTASQSNSTGVLLNFPEKSGLVKLVLPECDSLVLSLEVDGLTLEGNANDIVKVHGQGTEVNINFFTSIKLTVTANPDSCIVSAYYNVKDVEVSSEVLTEIVAEADSKVTDGFNQSKHNWIVHDYQGIVFVDGGPLMETLPLLDGNGEQVYEDGDQEVDEEGNLVYENGDPVLDERGDPILDGNGNTVYEQVPVYVQVPVFQDPTQVQDEEGNLLFQQVPTEVTKHRVVGYNTVPLVLPTKTMWYSNNEQVTVNGNPTQGKMPVYAGNVGDSFTATAEVADQDGNIQTGIDQTALNYPPKLFLPVIKIVDGDINHVVDEVYMAATLVSGVLTATGKFPSAGNWVLNKKRINKSLDEINADWHIIIDDLSFRIAEIAA